MSVRHLEREGLIAPLGKGRKGDVKSALQLAKRDLAAAQKMKKENADWTYNIAYNAMLQTGRALMYSRGYRPTGNKQHVSVVRFAEEVLEKEAQDLLLAFDRMRRKRHIAVYDTSGTISKTEAENALKRAQQFYEIIAKKA